MNRFRLCACLILATIAATSSFAVDSDTPPPANTAIHEKKEAPLIVSHGQEITLEDYLVTGKTTIFEFTTRLDGHCRTVSKRLDKLHAKRGDVAVVRIDINRPEIKGVDWSSPVCQQYEIHSVPAFKIYDPEGKLTADGKKAASLVDKWTDR